MRIYALSAIRSGDSNSGFDMHFLKLEMAQRASGYDADTNVRALYARSAVCQAYS